MKPWGIAIPILIGGSGLVSMSLIAWLLRNQVLPFWTISPHEIVNFTFTMQFMVLPASFIAMSLLYLYDKERFKSFFRVGMSTARNSHEWNVYGPLVLIGFTLGSIILMSFTLSGNLSFGKSFLSLLPLVLLLSATNAWSEEIFSRFVIVAGLHGKLKPETICLISAVMFGLPHFFGTPSGVFGVIMSGLLGWFLARSVIETRGLGWALLIHFLQDVVIFGAGAVSISNT